MDFNVRGKIVENHPLARYTSWRLGGPADIFFQPADKQDLQDFLQQLPAHTPLTWLGLGSNVLIRDAGIRGVVVHTLGRLNELELLADGTVRAEAGVTCAKLAKFCKTHGFAEGAFFAGIPGTVGGALFMNAGAFGGETWPQVVKVETMTRFGEIKTSACDAFQYTYRHVDGLDDAYFLAGYFTFNPGNTEQVDQNIKALLKKRADTQPVGTFNCGSVFRNPDNDYAARLIEAAGLKGFTIGDAIISPKHANFIINQGHATAAEVEQLIQHAQQTVQQKFGVQLIRECIILGDAI